MTSTEFLDAYLQRFKDGFTAPANAVVGYDMDVQWPDDTAPLLPNANRFRARLFARHSSEELVGFGRPNTVRLYEAIGVFYVEIYGPAGAASTPKKLGQLSEIVGGIYRGVSEPRGVWYRKVVIQEQPASTQWLSKRIGGTFTYTREG